MKVLRMAVMMFTAIACLPSAAGSQPTVQWLTGSDVTTYVPEDTTLGEHHFVDLEIPAGVTAGNLVQAILECYLDVDVRAAEVDVGGTTVEYKDPAPLLEVYPLSEEWTGTIDEGSLDEDMGERQLVRVGEGRRIRIDITRMVIGFLQNPTGNHGIIVGSLTNDRPGVFSMSDEFGGGIRVKVTYYR